MDKGDRTLIGWWALLVVLTLLSFEGGLGGLSAVAVTGLVIVIALVKIRVVVLHFMEVGHAPWSLRAPLEAWVVVLGAVLLALFYAFAA